ncbi:MAG: peptidylprolyl isomerase [Melioribacteraceae bacterium]|nr:peptidylprolyl isomerase [Melioribacteraceae bacterium]
MLESSKRELAAAIAIADYLKSYPIEISEDELKEYFEVNEEDYNFSDEAYILNLVSFSNEESAIRFRNNAIIDGWEKAVSKLVEEDELLESKQDKIFKLSEIQSRRISRVLQKLFNGEISLVIETELNNFVVVQQIDKINQNSIPNFKYVKNDVYKSFLILKQKEIVRNYLDSLLTQKNIKIY